jgi:hypothetical protein
MRRFLILTAFVLSATLIGPAMARADDKNHHEERYYDREGPESGPATRILQMASYAPR